MKPQTKEEQQAGHRKRLPLFRFSLGWCLLLALPLALLETVLALYIQPGPLGELLPTFRAYPLLAFLNFLPFLLLSLGFTFLWNNPFYAAALAGGIGGLLSLISRTMVEKRDEPLTPKDFALIKEAGSAMQNYGMGVHIPSLLALLAFVVVMVALGLLLGGKRPFQKLWQNLCLALVGAAACFGVLVGCVQQWYSSRELYQSFPVTNRSYISSVYQELGFPYCFCFNFNSYLVEKPEGYSTAEVRSYLEEHPDQPGNGEKVNVIMVMNEAFSDLTNFKEFDYPEGEEPLRFFNSLKESDRAISGHIVVPNFGGGTANTEFDVITGMQTNLIGQIGISSFRVLSHNVDSLFRVFRDEGYQTEFIHPGEDWFYNRQNVYRYFGAETLLFSEAFVDAQRKGNFVTDAAVLEKMQEEYEAAADAGTPYFNYTVTIQNHMAYTTKKYGDYPIPDAPLKKKLSWEAQAELSIYAEGIRDADAMLQGLTEYFDSREEPVVLAFFGDHLPNLGDNYLCYRELGMEIGETDNAEVSLKTFEPPYVIWVNQKAAEVLDFQNLKETLDLPDDNVINANYLGALILEMTGRRDQDGFFSYLNDLRRELPVYRNGIGRGGDGTYFAEPPEEYAEEIRKLRNWEYYRLKVE